MGAGGAPISTRSRLMKFLNLGIIAFFATVGLFLHVFSCVIDNNWLPLLILLVYVITPAPYFLASFFKGNDMSFNLNASSNNAAEWGIFGSAFVASGLIGIPAVMLHMHVITGGAFALCISGVAVIMGTVLFATCMNSRERGDSYGMMDMRG